MRNLVTGALVWVVIGTAGAAQTQDAQLMAPIQKFMDTFNKGDMAGASSTHAASEELAIMDEVPPFLWRGAKAFHAWAAALDSDAKKNGITEPIATISSPTRTEVSGDRAYVIVPAVYTFKQRGVAMRANAQMTVVLKRETSGWLITGWSWTSPRPQRADSSR